MSIAYPTSLDTLTNPGTGDPLNSPSHAGQHADANDAVEALEAKVGINSSAVTTSLDYKVTYSTSLVAPRGFLVNGKIVPSVSSNNLTVAIKGLDGNDPSATNPVVIRIGDTVRQITSALSVTKNAGTNWCGSGDAGIATNEIDYFVYLGYNATDGVVIGFARVPYGTIYSDFSATSTDHRYCAISTITNAASTDNYENIGRFAATLSATASFNWSVPTFTGANLIQRPIFKTRWLTWSPSFSWSNIPTSLTTDYKYQIENDIGRIRMLATGTTAGSVGSLCYITKPIVPKGFVTSSSVGAIPCQGTLIHTDNVSYTHFSSDVYYNGADNFLFQNVAAGSSVAFYVFITFQV